MTDTQQALRMDQRVCTQLRQQLRKQLCRKEIPRREFREQMRGLGKGGKRSNQ